MFKELSTCWKLTLGILVALVLMPDLLEIFVLFAYLIIIALILISNKFKDGR